MAVAKPDVYEHLGRIVDRVVTEKPSDALGAVEIISRLIKEAGAEGRPVGPKTPAPASEEELAARAGYSSKVLTLDQDFQDRDEEGKPTGVKACACTIPDFMADADMLAWAGVGFGDLESYKIMCSMRNLATREEVTTAGYKSMRLWGKILGLEKDYYVVEAERDAQPDWEGAEGEEPPDMKAVMYSFFAYYVTTDLCEGWTKLPELKPREVQVAREIKKVFSGDLKAPVITHPYFEGKEENLLRAQIALISADTVLTVNGMYKNDDSDPPHLVRPIADNLAEGFNPLEWGADLRGEALKKPEAWVHAQPHILISGLTFNEELPEEAPEKDNVEEYEKYLKLKAIHEMDPKRDLLRSIANDKLSWTIKQAGDTTLYAPAYGAQATEKPKLPWSQATTCVRSLTWPGAVCVSRASQLLTLYVGYGLMSGAPDFYFRAPLDIQDEPEEADEQPEPQGSEAKAADGDADDQ
jgi:radial spoke head protein 4A